MAVKIPSEQAVIEEAFAILLERLSPEKFARFWAMRQEGEGDYLRIRERLFAEETVDTLSEKVVAWEQRHTQK